MLVETKVEFYTKKRVQRLGNLGTLLKQKCFIKLCSSKFMEKSRITLGHAMDSMAAKCYVTNYSESCCLLCICFCLLEE